MHAGVDSIVSDPNYQEVLWPRFYGGPARPLKVSIGFLVTRDGAVSRVKIDRSSGLDGFDAAALRAVDAVNPPTPPPMPPKT